MYVFILYICTHRFVKNLYFHGLCKKEKGKNFAQRLILAPPFYLFYIGYTKSRIFMKRFCDYVGCEDLYATFFF
jgi:hypothetical protein